MTNIGVYPPNGIVTGRYDAITYTRVAEPGTETPEPASAVLLATGALALLARRRSA